MYSALAKAAPLRADIRLAQAISSFKAELSPEQKITLEAYQTGPREPSPDIHDVMRCTAEIDRHASGNLGGRRCFGPRLTNLLQSVQQFAAIGDVIVGSSQNILACGVWSLVRMTLLVRPLLTRSLRFCLILFSGLSSSLPVSRRSPLFLWLSVARRLATRTWPTSIRNLRICRRICLNTLL